MSKNERKTESLVRKHFDKFIDSIIVEEQSSDNLKIKKLLTTASKSGLGGGYPEFIIQYKNNPDFIIVVECKADITKHESANRDKYSDFAVDGALLYSSYLSKDFDVLVIAVSGETNENKKISHFLQVKGDKKAVEIFSNKLLSAEDYLTGYIKSPEKFRQDYEKLLSFSQELNEKLHGHKIVESDRSLLISCILIALENTAFSKTYKDYTEPKQLAEYLVTTVKNEFEIGNIGDAKLAILTSRFAFIKTDTSLSKKENVLRDIISDINENIKDFIKTHEYFDVLGQLYIEFLRYANSDKGLGIVLTPPHITEFMSELAEVNKDSVVYDNCTGTGGFLVSAMKIMIADAKGDQTKIKNIKQHQLIGVEYQAHIFALACSNMFIHQDGKSNILNGSCFDEEIVNEVKKFNPTVGLLNPPYKSDKKNDMDEYEFILNNLDCLEQGGKCVAIIPMQSAMAQTGKVYEYKKKALEQHTLEAVFSMPDELFFNSKVGVVSCIMVFTAKRPHPRNKKVYFGYYKDDGFVKRKTKGRVDLFQKFEKKIKEDWVTSYMNKEERAGFSVTRLVSADDEWCAEAYMETDYSVLSEDDFIKSVKDFVFFKELYL
jgi:type I restriction-modification system DNA methylase subunit